MNKKLKRVLKPMIGLLRKDTGTYLSDFNQAIERTKRLGLESPVVEIKNTRLLSKEIEEGLPYELKRLVGEIDPVDLHAQCMKVHWQLQNLMSDYLNCPCYLTIGYLELASGTPFYQSESDIKNMLSNGIEGSSIELHAWLTLPTMEIIDFTLSTTFAIWQKNSKGLGGIISKHADELTGGLKYKPLIIGEDFLFNLKVVV